MQTGSSPMGSLNHPPDGSVVSSAELDAQLQSILSSRTFAKSHRLQDLLRYTVSHIKSGSPEPLKEYLLGVEVFGRKATFDPRFDSIVRVQASRLRQKLEEYYATEGRGDAILITVPKGAYTPIAHRRREFEPQPRRWQAIWMGGIAALVFTALIAFFLLRPRIAPSHDPVMRRLTTDAGFTGYPALSTDGNWIAFASDRGRGGNLAIWVMPAHDASQARQLTANPANDYEPAFSPDSRHVAFRSDTDGGGIYIVPLAGGQSRLIAPYGRRPRFSKDGSLIAYWQRDETWGPARIFTVPSTGGAPTQLVPDFADAHYPVWSPDGSELLFCGTRNSDQPANGHDWWVLRLSTGEVIKTGAAPALSRAVPPGGRRLAGFSADILGIPGVWMDGELLFSTRLGDSENLWKVAISPERRITKEPERLTFGASLEAQPSLSGRTVAFVSGTLNINIWTTPMDADTGRSTGTAHPLTDDSGPFALSPSVSLDGRKVAFISTRGGSRDVWFKNLDTGNETSLTATPRLEEGYACLSADGSQVAYRVIVDPNQILYVTDSHSGAPRKVCENCGLPTDWSHDNRRLLYEPGSRIPGIGLLDLGTGAAKEIAVHATFKLRGARFSPDERWIAFYAETGARSRRIFVAPMQGNTLAAESEWVLVTAGTDVDLTPAWSPNGNLLYFISERDGFRCVWAQRLHPETKTPLGAPFAVEHFHTGGRALLTTFRANPAQIGLSASQTGIVYSVEELHGNIWTMTLP
jgi:Tol biopolymer transport system component